jgi:hypothetical protein
LFGIAQCGLLLFSIARNGLTISGSEERPAAARLQPNVGATLHFFRSSGVHGFVVALDANGGEKDRRLRGNIDHEDPIVRSFEKDEGRVRRVRAGSPPDAWVPPNGVAAALARIRDSRVQTHRNRDPREK